MVHVLQIDTYKSFVLTFEFLLRTMATIATMAKMAKMATVPTVSR
jgi:hypothetical protein